MSENPAKRLPIGQDKTILYKKAHPRLPSWFLPSLRNTKRNQLVDVLRGVAIILVVFSHLGVLLPLIQPHIKSAFGRDVGDISNGMGYYGVSVFFCISGFLITSGILKRCGKLSNIKSSDFWWLRFSRIMPMFCLCMLAMVAYHYLNVPAFRYKTDVAVWRDFTAAFSFRYNEHFGANDESHVWYPMWSLSVEEMFYLVLPFICLAIDGRVAAFWVGITLIFTSIYFRFTGESGPFSTFGCVDLLSLGCLVAIAQPARLKNALPQKLSSLLGLFCAILGYSIITYAILRDHPFTTPAYNSLICGVGACFALVSTQLLNPPSWLRILLVPISAMGVISYEVYLIHMPVTSGFSPLASTGWVFVVISVTLGIFVHEFFSEPMNVALRALPQELKEGSKRLIPSIVLRSALGIFSILVVGYFFRNLSRPLNARFQLTNIVKLPDGTREPLVYAGKAMRADLFFIEHEAGGKVKVGFDHWGAAGPLSEALDPKFLEGGTFDVYFGSDQLYALYNGKSILAFPVHAYPARKTFIGINDINFSGTLPKAKSKLERIQ